MSYSITVACRNGVVTLGEGGGEVPDGSWTIGGHEDDHSASINVVRRNPNGRFAAEAQHFSSHRNYDERNFQQLEGSSSPLMVFTEPTSFKKWSSGGHGYQILWRNFEGGPEYLTQDEAAVNRSNDLHILDGAHLYPDPGVADVPQPDGEQYPDNP